MGKYKPRHKTNEYKANFADMTKEWYIANGYKIGVSTDQNAIDRAERDVMEAYVHKILPSADPETSDTVAHIVADLAFLALSQRSVFLTRSGAKEKTGTNSVSPDAWALLSEMAGVAKMRIRQLREMTGAVADANVRDICKIYFKTHFFHA